MTDQPELTADPSATLQEQLDRANKKLVQSELRNHAIRAGMIDLDLLKLLDTAGFSVDDNGNLPQATEALARLQREKPWMFANSNSSQVKPAPVAEPPKARNAMTMTRSEWQAARDKLVRGR